MPYGIFYAVRHKSCYTSPLNDTVVFVICFVTYLPENYT